MMDYARSDSHFLIPLYGIFQQILTGNIGAVWLREDLAQEEWALYLKNIANRKKGG
jgi:ribonuclease D